MDRNAKRNPDDSYDGAFERFLTSAIATILTLVFSWRLLMETSPKELCYLDEGILEVDVSSDNQKTSKSTKFIDAEETSELNKDKQENSEVIITATKSTELEANDAQDNIDPFDGETIMLMNVNNGNVNYRRQEQCVYEAKKIHQQKNVNEISMSEKDKNSVILNEDVDYIPADSIPGGLISGDNCVGKPGNCNDSFSNIFKNARDRKEQSFSDKLQSPLKYEEQMATINFRYDEDCYSDEDEDDDADDDDDESSSDYEEEEVQEAELDRYVLYDPVLEAIEEERSEDLSNSSDGTTIANQSDLEVDFSPESETSSSSAEEGRTYYVTGRYNEDEMARFSDGVTNPEEDELSSSIAIGIPFKDDCDSNSLQKIEKYIDKNMPSLQKWPSGELLNEDMYPSSNSDQKEEIKCTADGESPLQTEQYIIRDDRGLCRSELNMEIGDSNQENTVLPDNVDTIQRKKMFESSENMKDNSSDSYVTSQSLWNEGTSYVAKDRSQQISDSADLTFRLHSIPLKQGQPGTKSYIPTVKKTGDLSTYKGQHHDIPVDKHLENRNLETHVNNGQNVTNARCVLSDQDKKCQQDCTDFIDSDTSINTELFTGKTCSLKDQLQNGTCKYADVRVNKVQGAANEGTCSDNKRIEETENSELSLTGCNPPDSKKCALREECFKTESVSKPLESCRNYLKSHKWTGNNNTGDSAQSELNINTVTNISDNVIHDESKPKKRFSEQEHGKYGTEINEQVAPCRYEEQSFVSQHCRPESISTVEYLGDTNTDLCDIKTGISEYCDSKRSVAPNVPSNREVSTNYGKKVNVSSAPDKSLLGNLDRDNGTERKGSSGVIKYYDDGSSYAKVDLSGEDPIFDTQSHTRETLTYQNTFHTGTVHAGLNSCLYRDCHISKCGEAVPKGLNKSINASNKTCYTVAKGLSVWNGSVNKQQKDFICHSSQFTNKYTFQYKSNSLSTDKALNKLDNDNVVKETAKILSDSSMNHSVVSSANIVNRETSMGSGISAKRNDLYNISITHEDFPKVSSSNAKMDHVLSADELGDSWWESKHMDSKRDSCGVSDSGFEEIDQDRSTMKHGLCFTAVALAKRNELIARNYEDNIVSRAEATDKSQNIAVARATARAAVMASSCISATSELTENRNSVRKYFDVVISTTCSIRGEHLGNGIRVTVRTMAINGSQSRQPVLQLGTQYNAINCTNVFTSPVKLIVSVDQGATANNSNVNNCSRIIEMDLPGHINDIGLEEAISKSVNQILCGSTTEPQNQWSRITRLHDSIDSVTRKVSQAYRNEYSSQEDNFQSVSSTSPGNPEYIHHESRALNSKDGANDGFSTHYSCHLQRPDFTYTGRSTNEESGYTTLEHKSQPRRTANIDTGYKPSTHDSLEKTKYPAENINKTIGENLAGTGAINSDVASTEQFISGGRFPGVIDVTVEKPIQTDYHKENSRSDKAGVSGYSTWLNPARQTSTEESAGDNQMDSNKILKESDMYGFDDEFSYSQILRAASKHSQTFVGNKSVRQHTGPENNIASRGGKQDTSFYAYKKSDSESKGVNFNSKQVPVTEAQASYKSITKDCVPSVTLNLQGQQHDCRLIYSKPPLTLASFSEPAITGEQFTESGFCDTAQFDRYQYDNVVNKPSVNGDLGHMPGIQNSAMAGTQLQKQYKSVLQTKFVDQRTPLSFLKTLEPPEKDTPVSRLKINDARSGYVHEASEDYYQKHGVIDKEFEKRKHLGSSYQALHEKIGSLKIDDNDVDTKKNVSQALADANDAKRKLENVKLQAPSSQHFDKAWTSIPFVMSKSYEHSIDDTSSETSSFSMAKSVDNLTRTPSVTSLAKQFFSKPSSYTSLLETDLDTGEHREIAIVQETDVDSITTGKAKSMSNLCHRIIDTFERDTWDKTQSMDLLQESSGSPGSSNNSVVSKESDLMPAGNHNQNQSKSEHEIRITNSLNRLNLPDWYKSYKGRTSDTEIRTEFKPTQNDTITSCRPEVLHCDAHKKTGIVHAKPVVIRHRVTPNRSRSVSDTSSVDEKPFLLPSAKLRETRDRVFKPIKIKSREEIMKTVNTVQSEESKQTAKDIYLRLRGSASTVSSDGHSPKSFSSASHSSESKKGHRHNVQNTTEEKSNGLDSSTQGSSKFGNNQNDVHIHNGIQSKSPVTSHRSKQFISESYEASSKHPQKEQKIIKQVNNINGSKQSSSDHSDLTVGHINNGVPFPGPLESSANIGGFQSSSVAQLPKAINSKCEPQNDKVRSGEITNNLNNEGPSFTSTVRMADSTNNWKTDKHESGDVFPVLSYANSPGSRRKYNPDSPSSVRKELHVTLTDTKTQKAYSEDGDGDESFENIIESLIAISEKKSTASGAASDCLESEDHPPSRSLQYLKQIETPQSSLTSVLTPRSGSGSDSVRRPWESSRRSQTEICKEDLSEKQYSTEAEDQLGEEVVIVKCRNTKCSKSAALEEARSSYKTCHNCYTYYCSRECRKAHWERHKKKCLFSRVNSACKHVIKFIHDDSELTHHVSRIARTGYLSTGRGCVMLVFPDPPQADEFIRNRGCAMDIPASYTGIKELQESNIVDEHMNDLIQMCKTYNPEIKFVIDVAIVVKNVESEIMKAFALPRHEGATVHKSAKLRLSSVIASSRVNKREDPETLILTAVPGSEYTENMEERKAREVCFINIQMKLRQRGVSLRHHYPDIYTKLCAYVATKENFTPIIIYPYDKKTGKRFMCVIMPQSEPEVEWLQDPDLLDELDLMTDV